jgi:DHA1 family bicyclomycin/chloramphenicol resistance-like MFS transporter
MKPTLTETAGGAQAGGTRPIMSEMRTAVVGALIVALGPISMALYTPAMPTIVTAFQTTPAHVKLTLTVFFFGFAFAQLVCGPLSDAYGRRPVAIGFFSIYLVGSVVALLAPGIEWLLVGRALQGIGVAAGTAISRAIVRDQFTGQVSARIMNLIGLMLAVGPAVAPVLGGLILTLFGWQAIFFAMVAYGLAVVALLWLGVPETNASPDPALAHPRGIVRSYGMLVRDRSFMRSSLLLGLTLGGLFTMAALVPFVLMDVVGLTPTQFGFAMLAQTGAFTAGSALTARLLRRIDAMRLVPVGLAVVVAAGLGFGIGLQVFPASVYTVMGPAALWAFGIALVMPGTTTSALAGFASIAGAASALTGFFQVGGGLAGSAVAALAFRDPFLALTVVMPGMAALAALAHLGLAPRR